LFSEFSVVAGELAGTLEDLAAGGLSDRAAAVVDELERRAQELLRQVGGLSLEALGDLAMAAERGRTDHL
jgi:hypothetical protein